MNLPKWKAFEKDIHAIHAQFAADGTEVEHDVKLMGTQSQILRQVDVAIRADVSGYRILIVIECKDKKRPIDVNDVSEFAVKVKDVGASKGVMISTSGYTEGAISTAQSYGLDILTFEEVSQEQLGRLATVLVTATKSEAKWRVKGQLVDPDVTQSKLVMDHDMMLYDENGTENGTVRTQAERHMAAGLVPRTRGIHLLSFGVVFLMVDKQLRPVQVWIEVTVNIRYFIAKFPLLRTRISDAGNAKLVRDMLRTPHISVAPWEVPQPEWTEIDSLEGLAISSALAIHNGPDRLGPLSVLPSAA